jgi:hypothetical protein
MDDVRESFNIIINNAKRDHKKKKGKIPLAVIAKMKALRKNIDTINENVLKINNDIEQTRQQYVPPSPPNAPPMSPAEASVCKRKIDK